MKVKLKKQVKGKWTVVPAQDLLGRSISTYLLETKEVAMAALYDKQDKPRVFITNSAEWAQKYRDQGLCLTVKELRALVGEATVPGIVVEAFPGSEFIEVKLEE